MSTYAAATSIAPFPAGRMLFAQHASSNERALGLQPEAPEVALMRRDFERWVMSIHGSSDNFRLCRTNASGLYRDRAVRLGWSTWQAAIESGNANEDAFNGWFANMGGTAAVTPGRAPAGAAERESICPVVFAWKAWRTALRRTAHRRGAVPADSAAAIALT